MIAAKIERQDPVAIAPGSVTTLVVTVARYGEGEVLAMGVISKIKRPPLTTRNLTLTRSTLVGSVVPIAVDGKQEGSGLKY